MYEIALILGYSDAKMEEMQADAASEIENMHAYAVKYRKMSSAAKPKSKEKFLAVMSHLDSIFPAKKKKRTKDEIIVVCAVSENGFKQNVYFQVKYIYNWLHKLN